MKLSCLIAVGLLSSTLLHTAHAFDLLSAEQAAAEHYGMCALI